MGETAIKPYVWTDEHGVMRVGSTRVMLDGIVYRFQEGRSAESIRDCWPSLSLAEVYGAITHYLSHRPLIDEYLRTQEESYEKLRQESERKHPELYEKMRKARDMKALKSSPQ